MRMIHAVTLMYMLAMVVLMASACENFDPDVDCPGHSTSFVDDCDPMCFYQCENMGNVYNATKRCCRECQVWSQDKLTCVLGPDVKCVPSNQTNNATVCTLEKVNNYFFVDTSVSYSSVQACPVNTAFNETTCSCTHDDTNPMVAGKQITCIDFSTGWNNLQGSKGVWVQSTNVEVVDCTSEGLASSCGDFTSAQGASMKIPRLANALDSFSQFSVAFHYKKTGGSSPQYLVGNGNCGLDSSLNIISPENKIEVNALNTSSTLFSSGALDALDGEFHHVAVVFDGLLMTTYLDGVVAKVEEFSRLKRVQYAMFIGNSVCESLQFQGYMDTISFAKVAFSPSQVAFLNENKEECMP